MGTVGEDGPPVRLRVKLFVVAFLAAFGVCGLAGAELWPLTGWELFSHVRTGLGPRWVVTVVAPDGSEQPLPFADLPSGYRSWLHVASGLPGRPPVARERVCRAWGDAAARVISGPLVEIRVYGHDREGREVRYACTRGPAT